MSSASADLPSDEIGQAYVQLALRIEQHLPGYIDAYFGPPAWKSQAETEGKSSLEVLSGQARELAQAVHHGALDPSRRRFLSKQVAAMQTTLRVLARDPLPFVEEVEMIYDIIPQHVDEAVFENAMRELESLVPGEGALNDRLRARRRRFEIDQEKAPGLFELAKEETRRRTRGLFALPGDEDVELRLVKDKPWGAYNWYLGHHRSLIEINTDSPIHVNGLAGLMAHEGYPGHHTEHALKEQELYERRGWLEATVLLINAPECVISEGIATTAAEVIFKDGEMERWLCSEIYPRAGVTDDLSPEAVQRIHEASRALNGVSGNAALMLHVEGQSADTIVEYLLRYTSRTPEEAQRGMRFMTNPVLRSYIFTYAYGHDLLTELFKRHDKVEVFRRVLREALTPTDLREWLS